MNCNQFMTFEECCDKYIENCRLRNLREGTINHYRQSFNQFYKYFKPEMSIHSFNKESYENFILYLKDNLNNDISINSYLRDLITVMHFCFKEGYVTPFKMRSIKTNNAHKETYSEYELKVLLKKPDMKECKFVEYQAWVMTNFLFCTGVRQKSLMNIKIKDIDFDNRVLNVTFTKNRKPLLIPLNTTIVEILKEFLKYRRHSSSNDYLFCNVYGQKLVKSTCYHMLYSYNKRRGIETTGIHRYRHTFAKEWILSGGNVVTLSRLLGHSSLAITQNYINLLVSDLGKQVDEINLLKKFNSRESIKMR